MRKILVCQHVAHEPLGTLDPLFRDEGFRIRYANFGRHPSLKADLEGYNGLVVLGGPMNVDEIERHPHLAYEVRLIGEAIKKEIPVLGICLGAQLIAKALGAPVTRNPEKEIGWYELSLTNKGRADPLFDHFRPTEKVFQWHGDTFKIPSGCDHLAFSPQCRNQAFRHGQKVYALQFHLEVDQPMIERWLTVPVNRRELEGLKGVIDPEVIQRETPDHIGRLNELGQRTFSTFIGFFGEKRKYQRLESR